MPTMELLKGRSIKITLCILCPAFTHKVSAGHKVAINYMSDNTRDISKMGYREIDMAADLMKKYANGGQWEGENNLSDGVAVEFNPSSGNVFLVDEDYNTAMLNDEDKLEMFLNCGYCSAEGFASEDDNLKPILEGKYCVECIKKGNE